MEYMMMNEQEVMEKLRTTDLRQTCRYVDMIGTGARCIPRPVATGRVICVM